MRWQFGTWSRSDSLPAAAELGRLARHDLNSVDSERLRTRGLELVGQATRRLSARLCRFEGMRDMNARVRFATWINVILT